MKNTLLIFAGLTMTAGLASASITYTTPCGLLMGPNNSTGVNGQTCSATADPGDYLTSMTISITDDYTGYQTGNPIVSYSGTLTDSASLYGAPTFCNVGTGGSPLGSVACLATILPSATVTNSNTSITSFTIQITNGENTVAGGTVLGASENMTLTATEAAIPTTGTPEPTTFGLVGGALLGLGLLRKKVVRS